MSGEAQFPTFPPSVREDDLLLWCAAPDCVLSQVLPDTPANERWLIERGNSHHTVNPTHDITLDRLGDTQWTWTPTGEVLNGYELALRLVARTAAQQ